MHPPILGKVAVSSGEMFCMARRSEAEEMGGGEANLNARARRPSPPPQPSPPPSPPPDLSLSPLHHLLFPLLLPLAPLRPLRRRAFHPAFHRAPLFRRFHSQPALPCPLHPLSSASFPFLPIHSPPLPCLPSPPSPPLPSPLLTLLSTTSALRHRSRSARCWMAPHVFSRFFCSGRVSPASRQSSSRPLLSPPPA